MCVCVCVYMHTEGTTFRITGQEQLLGEKSTACQVMEPDILWAVESQCELMSRSVNCPIDKWFGRSLFGCSVGKRMGWGRWGDW